MSSKEPSAGPHPLREKIRSIVRRILPHAWAVTMVAVYAVGPAAAQPAGCEVSGELQPIFDLLNSITDLTLAAGVTIAALGLGAAGIMYIWPGQDMTRRAKGTITNTVIGTVIVLSANAVVAFLTSSLGGAVC